MLAVFAIGAVASASASAFNLEWEVCEKGGTEKWSEHLCNAGKGTGEWSWRVLAAGETRNVVSKIKSAEFVLIAAGIEVKCKSANDTGTITGGKPGTDETTVMFATCTTSKPTCKVKSATKPAGEILVSNIGTKLVEGLKKDGVTKVIADEFFKAGEFVTLEFGEVEKGGKLEKACPGIPLTTKVTGKIFAIVTNLAGGGIMLTFPPKAELLKTPVNTLNVFGLAAELVGEEEVTLENGWAMRAS